MVPIAQKAGWALWLVQEISLPQVFESQTIQPAGSYYTDYTILATINQQ
jgi:hypothetical protein